MRTISNIQKYYIIYKPFQVLSQFSREGEKNTLKDFFDVPGDVYPVGRLDYDSEGLLILTNDTSLNARLLHPRNAHSRTYWVQVEGDITAEALTRLRNGVEISVNGKTHRTLPAKVSRFDTPPELPERNPPIRFRKSVPDSWISITLTEGKNRQVRKMTAAAGYPTLRLVRYSIEKISLGKMQPGDMKELKRSEIYSQLFGK